MKLGAHALVVVAIITSGVEAATVAVAAITPLMNLLTMSAILTSNSAQQTGSHVLTLEAGVSNR